jgi:DNA repair exonuclease SbcCD ATPase subunit
MMKRLLDTAAEVIKGDVKRCPICGSPTVDPAYVKEQLSEVISKLQKLEREIKNLQNERDKLTNALEISGKLRNKENNISYEINYLDSEIKRIKRETEPYEPIAKTREIELEEFKRKREDILNELKVLEMSIKDISDELGRVSGKLGELKEKWDTLEGKLDEIKRELGSPEHLEIASTKVPVEKAVEICPYLIKSLEQLIEHLTDKIERQKADFAKRFNDAISRLLRDLQFELDAMIDPNTLELIVKREGKIQRLTSLSLSERAALALLIQIALKEAFLPDIPLFLVDEVILGFDRSRVERIINYLLEMAKNKGMTIVLTRLSDKEEVRVITDASSNFSLLP